MVDHATGNPAGPDADLHARIRALTDAQHALRAAPPPHDQARLDELERELDQTWDLLRQRDALRAVGRDPAAAHERPQAEVEGYRQ